MDANPSEHQKRRFRQQLLEWYRINRRVLPWRKHPTLYKTVVSEFMLQQTQVKTMLPYFERWLQRFPDFPALARSSEDAVMKYWEGLGYYSRARSLYRLSQRIVKLKTIPKDPGSWQEFPGVGPYTASAVCSIAFNHPAAVVDGNVVRILTRLTADNTPFADNGSAVSAVRPLAQSLLNRASPGEHNQAMMELGATVCSRRNPSCSHCPVEIFCEARKNETQHCFPVIKRKPTVSVRKERVFILHRGRLLLDREPSATKLLSGLFELPLLARVPRCNRGKLLMVAKRSITHHRIEEHIYSAGINTVSLKSDSRLVWVPLKEVSALALSGPHRRWVTKLLADNPINTTDSQPSTAEGLRRVE